MWALLQRLELDDGREGPEMARSASRQWTEVGPLRSFGFLSTNGCNESINGRSTEFWQVDSLTLEAPKSTRTATRRA